MKLEISYHNCDFINESNLSKNNDKIITKIQETLDNLHALNIVKDKELLSQTIFETLKFSKGKKNFIVFGTGGSNLGARALIDILQGDEKVNIFFYDNIDPISFKNSISKIDLSSAGIIVISKSGSTPETLSQYACLIEIFDQKNELNTLFNNSLIITEDKKSPLANIARKNNCTLLRHENNIGGRFSIFSNVSLIPAILAGLDVKKIHEGALAEIKTQENLDILKIAQLFRYQVAKSSLANNVIMTYSDALFYYGKWYLQLWAESIGKNNKGITAIHSVGTTDQHSQLQLYLDGPRDKFFTFITTNHANKGLQLHNKTMQENEINYLVDKKMGDLMQAEQKATIDTFNLNKFSYREIHLQNINETSIGQLMAFSIMETIAACIYFEVNPFDQPAVEQGKKLTKQYLS
jgi:glucose-6-phosphate isomerase